MIGKTIFQRGKCNSKGFKIVTRWKCVDVRIKDGIDHNKAQMAMRAEQYFNACQFCKYFVPDSEQLAQPSATPPALRPQEKSADAQSREIDPADPDGIEIF